MKKDNISNKADNTKDKAQENHVKMTQTPVPSLILRLSCSTVVSMLAGTTYNIVDMYFVSDLGTSAVAAVGILFSVLAMIQAVGYTFGMGAGSRISRFLGEQKEKEAGRDASAAVLMALVAGLILMAAGFLWAEAIDRFSGFNGYNRDLRARLWLLDPAYSSGHVCVVCTQQCSAGGRDARLGIGWNWKWCCLKCSLRSDFGVRFGTWNPRSGNRDILWTECKPCYYADRNAEREKRDRIKGAEREAVQADGSRYYENRYSVFLPSGAGLCGDHPVESGSQSIWG